jgi:hypothetical protein
MLTGKFQISKLTVQLLQSFSNVFYTFQHGICKRC